MKSYMKFIRVFVFGAMPISAGLAVGALVDARVVPGWSLFPTALAMFLFVLWRISRAQPKGV